MPRKPHCLRSSSCWGCATMMSCGAHGAGAGNAGARTLWAAASLHRAQGRPQRRGWDSPLALRHLSHYLPHNSPACSPSPRLGALLAQRGGQLLADAPAGAGQQHGAALKWWGSHKKGMEAERRAGACSRPSMGSTARLLGREEGRRRAVSWRGRQRLASAGGDEAAASGPPILAPVSKLASPLQGPWKALGRR